MIRLSSRERPSSYHQEPLGAHQVKPPVGSGVQSALGQIPGCLAWRFFSFDPVKLFELGLGGRGDAGCDAPGESEICRPAALQGPSLKMKVVSASLPRPQETTLRTRRRHQTKTPPLSPILIAFTF